MTPEVTTLSQTQPERILIIKHGAFGDMILATGPLRAIRDAHPTAHLTLLTTAPFVSVVAQMGIFDAIRVDARPKGLTGLIQRVKMGVQLRQQNYDRVYDLQHSSRTATYFQMMRWGRPTLEWSGIAQGCSHPHSNPARDHMHTIERTAEQLHMAGIDTVPDFDLDWLAGDITHLNVPDCCVIMVPSASPKRPEKVWPIDAYAHLALNLEQLGLTPVIVGAQNDQPAAARIKEHAPSTVDLTGKTSFGQLASVARLARAAVGNDTGPMHLCAALGVKSLVLFSNASIPSQTAPRGPVVVIKQVDDLSKLTSDEVARLFEAEILSR